MMTSIETTIEISAQYAPPPHRSDKLTFRGDLVDLSCPDGHEHWTAKLYIDQAAAYWYPLLPLADRMPVLLSSNSAIAPITVEAGNLLRTEQATWVPLRGPMSTFSMVAAVDTAAQHDAPVRPYREVPRTPVGRVLPIVLDTRYNRDNPPGQTLGREPG